MNTKMKKLKHNLLEAILLSLMVVLFLTCFVSAEDQTNNILRVHPTNPRYFTNGSGEAIYLAGVDNFRALQDWNAKGVGTFDYQEFLDYLQSYNHNFLRMWTWEHVYEHDYDEGDYCGDYFNIYPPHVWKRTGPGTAIDGLLKFDLTKLDQGYFDRLRSRVVDAGNHNIYVAFMFFQRFSLGQYEWIGHPYNSANNINGINGDADGDGEGYETHTLSNSGITAIQEAYVKKVIDTLWDLDNVLYEVANEPFVEEGEINSLDAIVDWQYHIINLIHDYELENYGRQHPVGLTADAPLIHPSLFASPAEYVSPASSYAGSEWRLDPPVATGNKVIIADTDHIHPDRGPGYHPWLWMCLTRGHSVNAVDGDGEVEDWFSAEDSRVMRDTWSYANKMNLSSMIPSDSSSHCSTKYCLRNPGQEYLIYQPDAGSFTVDLVARDYSYEWFNPDTGSVSETGDISASGGSQSFTPPFSGDAVLYLYVETLDPNTIPQTNWELKYTDSEELIGENGAATNAFDGDTSTIWHTKYQGGSDAQPHEIQIDLGDYYDITGFRYLPRQDDGDNGRIRNYEFYTSADGNGWNFVLTGAFADNANEQEAIFAQEEKGVKYIRLKSLSVYDDDAWTTVSEINLLGTLCSDTIQGDVNGDNEVNIQDVILCVNVILGIEQDAGIMDRADLNEDGSVNILDVMRVVIEILDL